MNVFHTTKRRKVQEKPCYRIRKEDPRTVKLPEDYGALAARDDIQKEPTL
jgi:hypothetical protein